MPPDSVLPPPADPDATRIDGPDLLPFDDPATAMLDGLRQAPASGGPRRQRRPLVPVIVAAALLALVLLLSIPWGFAVARRLAGGADPAGIPQA